DAPGHVDEPRAGGRDPRGRESATALGHDSARPPRLSGSPRGARGVRVAGAAAGHPGAGARGPAPDAALPGPHGRRPLTAPMLPALWRLVRRSPRIAIATVPGAAPLGLLWLSSRPAPPVGAPGAGSGTP